MSRTIACRSVLRRLFIGLGSGIIVAGLGWFLFAQEIRHMSSIPESTKVKLFTDQEQSTNFSWSHPGFSWHGAVAKEGFMFGFGLMAIGTAILAAALPTISRVSNEDPDSDGMVR